MYINHQKLMHLPVFTESGEKLGQIHDIEIDVETHHIRKYIIGPRFLGKETYLVTPAQIKSISSEKIVVEDTIIKDTGKISEKKVVPPALDTLMPSIENIEKKP